MTSGPVLRDEGHARVLEASSDWWVSCCRQALTTLASSGRVFTIEDFRDLGVPEPHHGNAWGGFLCAAAKADLIERVGSVQARRPESRGRWLGQWVGVREEAA